MFGADVAHWQRFLNYRGLYSGNINGKFDSATQEASFEFQREQKLHGKEPADDGVFEAAHWLGYEIPQLHPPREYFDRDGTVDLSSSDYTALNRLAYLYCLWTDEKITVTSGTRTPHKQAEAMYENWYYHRNQGTHYNNREAEGEVRQAYDASVAAHEHRSATVDAMTSVIENQVRRHVYLSWHLTGRAVDVRKRDLSSKERDAFERLAGGLGVRLLDEQDHYHVQFP